MARWQSLHVSSSILKFTVEDTPYKEPYKSLHSVASQQHLIQHIKIFTSQILNLTLSLQDLSISKLQGIKRIYLTYREYSTGAK